MAVMWRSALLLLASLALASCSRTAASPSESSENPASAAASSDVKPLALTYTTPTVGAAVQVAASGLPPGKIVDVVPAKRDIIRGRRPRWRKLKRTAGR